ncbi:hypothetical protein MAR_003731 [Mya arenaria]|uniref:Uncharacterized protein n=1 Tax=Mya arenaria TaxID=6604 RepID=A0ABY7G6Z0_MYAAR|nr:hypothetical protein MAR_003731 [Mya arenaria]
MGSFKSLVLLAMVCVQLQMIASMTNYEFYQAVKPYIDDENVEYRGRAVADDDDVIYLPGGPNDEFDHMPALCYGVPGLSIAKVCLDLYGLDMAQRKICAKVVGKLDIKVHEFKVNLDLGCVKIPILKDADSLYLGQAGADDVDMPYADVTKPADRLMSLFVTELWKSLNNLDN